MQNTVKVPGATYQRATSSLATDWKQAKMETVKVKDYLTRHFAQGPTSQQACSLAQIGEADIPYHILMS